MNKIAIIICCMILVLICGCGNRNKVVDDNEVNPQQQESMVNEEYSKNYSEETKVESSADEEPKNADSSADPSVVVESQDPAANEDQTEYVIMLEKHDEFPVIPLSVTWGEDIFDECYARANDEQKARLDELRPEQLGINNVRLIYQIMGELPEDLPRLTLDQAIAIGTEFQNSLETKESDVSWCRKLARAYNQYVGGPDYLGGSTMEISIYYFDEERNEEIQVVPGLVMYLNQTTGEYKMILDSNGYIVGNSITTSQAIECAWDEIQTRYGVCKDWNVTNCTFGEWKEMGFTECWVIDMKFTDSKLGSIKEVRVGVDSTGKILEVVPR